MSVFDAEKFFEALNRKRRAERIQWREVGRRTGVSPSTFSRIGLDGHSPSVENLARLLLWLGSTDLAPFLAGPHGTVDAIDKELNP